MFKEAANTNTNKILNSNFWNDPEDQYDQWDYLHDNYREEYYVRDLLSQQGVHLGILNEDKTELINYGYLEDNPDCNSFEVDDDLDNHQYH